MALGAHSVPGLGGPRPVEPVVGRDHRVRVEVEPLTQIRIPGELTGTGGVRRGTAPDTAAAARGQRCG